MSSVYFMVVNRVRVLHKTIIQGLFIQNATAALRRWSK